MPDDRNGLPVMEPDAVEDLGMADDLIVADDRLVQLSEDLQDAGNATQAREYALLLGVDGGGGAQPGFDARCGSGVTRRFVFKQRVLQNGCNSAAMPVQ